MIKPFLKRIVFNMVSHAGRNINNLRHADDTRKQGTKELHVESERE